MARELQEMEVTTATGLKTTYRVSSDDRDRYERMSKTNEERLERRKQREQRASEQREEQPQSEAHKARQPVRGGDVKTKT